MLMKYYIITFIDLTLFDNIMKFIEDERLIYYLGATSKAHPGLATKDMRISFAQN